MLVLAEGQLSKITEFSLENSFPGRFDLRVRNEEFEIYGNGRNVEMIVITTLILSIVLLLLILSLGVSSSRSIGCIRGICAVGLGVEY